MIKFRQKEYGEVTDSLKKAIKNNPFSVGTFVLSGGNLVTNLKRHKTDKEYQKDQLEAMKDLTSTLTGVNKTLKKSALSNSDNGEENSIFYKFRKRKYFSSNNMISFRQKNYSILDNTIKGANIGASLGTFGGLFAPDKIKVNGKDDPKSIISIKRKYNKVGKVGKRFLAPAIGALIGAGLGAIYGVIKEGEEILSRKSINSNRLMPDVLGNLKKLSFKEDIDFTKQPKIANQLKTRVCIVIARGNGDLKILINTVSDTKLKDLSLDTVKNIPNTSAITTTASNNYNDIIITTISDGSADSGLITGICEKFIRSGYPVYLVEVG